MAAKEPALQTVVEVTEYLRIDIDTERWLCKRCGEDLGDAREPYKKGCLIRARDAREVHFPIGPNKDFHFSFNPEWTMIVEFYCPGCGVMVENEYLPPGHPLTWDIQLDIDKLKEKYGKTSQAASKVAKRLNRPRKKAT